MKKNYYVSESTIHGKEIFANQYFVAGEYIGKCLVPVFKSKMHPDKEYGFSDVSERLGTVVEKTQLEKYLNHQARPNAELFFENKLQLSLRTIADIAEGEEITVEYGDAFDKIDKLQENLSNKKYA